MAAADLASVTRRPVGAEDLPFLERLYASTRTAELALAGWSEEQQAAFVRSQFALQTSHYATHFPDASRELVTVDGVAAGRLYVGRGPARIHIVDIALLPEFRGAGIGTRLLEEVLREAEGRGVPVTLHVERHNPAMRLYERLGFESDERAEGAGGEEIYVEMRWRPARSPTGAAQANTAS